MSLTKVSYSMIQGGPVSVKDFGAVGDGVTDDTAALTAFFSSITSNTAYFLPAGVYLTTGFSQTFTSLSNVKIFSEGAVIKLNTDQTTLSNLLKFVTSTDIEVTGLTFDGDAYIVNAFYFDTCQRVNFQNNTFNKFWRTSPTVDGLAFYAEKCTQVNVSNNTFYRVNRGITFDESSTVSTNVTIDANTFFEMGFGCITPAHKYCVVSNNTMRYASLGPYPQNVSATRTDMRNPAWTPTLTTSSYGGGQGPAINTGSGLPNAFNCYPENLVITNNVIDQVAEYAIGIEGAKYYDTREFAGPALNVIISNNSISNTGIECILVSGTNGLQIIGNTLENANLAQSGAGFATISARAVDASFSGQSLANRQLNGSYNISVTGNTFRDTNGYVPYGIYSDAANTAQALGNYTISANNFEMRKTGSYGVLVNTLDADPKLYKINIVGNNFGMSANTGNSYIQISDVEPVNWTVSGNRFDGFNDIFCPSGVRTDAMLGVPEGYSTSSPSTNFPKFVSGTVSVQYATNVDSATVAGNFYGFETESSNGPSQGYFGYYGQGSGGSYSPGSFLMGYKTGASTWVQHYAWNTTEFSPVTDNGKSLGTSGSRWSVVYAATGAINTSDERTKQDIRDLNEAERQAAIAVKKLIKAFRFKDAVEKKGDAARIHFGVMAQQVAKAFVDVGLDPNQYGLFCYDEWEDQFDSQGNTIVSAGNRYGIRYDELLAFVIAQPA